VGQFRTDARVVGLYRRGAARSRGQVRDLVVSEYVQIGFGSGGCGDGVEVRVGHRCLAYRPPVGVPGGDGLGESDRSRAHRSWTGDHEGGQQIRLIGVG
jgi:hypothetical protein